MTGTAGDDGSIASVTLNGVGATLAGGTWPATIPLALAFTPTGGKAASRKLKLTLR